MPINPDKQISSGDKSAIIMSNVGWHDVYRSFRAVATIMWLRTPWCGRRPAARHARRVPTATHWRLMTPFDTFEFLSLVNFKLPHFVFYIMYVVSYLQFNSNSHLIKLCRILFFEYLSIKFMKLYCLYICSNK